LDTGLGGCGLAVPKDMAEDMKWRIPPVVNPKSSRTLQGIISSSVGRLDGSVRLGRFEFENPIVHVRGKEPVIGSQFLKHFRLTIDQRRMELALEGESSQPIVQPSLRDCGFRCNKMVPGFWLVTRAISGVALADLGLKEGDQILSICSTPVDEISAFNDLVEKNKVLKVELERDGHTLLHLDVPTVTIVP